MEPIPLYMLKMSISHAQRTGVDAYGKPAYGAATTVSRVYAEPAASAVLGSLGDKQRYDLTVFYDAKNSSPAARAFAELDKVVFSGKTYVVRSVLDTYDPYSGELAFREVRLVGA